MMARSTAAQRQALPRDWSRRREVTRRLADSQCEARTDDGARCVVAGVDVGHVDPLGGHDPLNLLWLCREHVEAKAHAEVQVAQTVVSVVRAVGG